MTERGLPHADSAPACPFVALEDERDERSSVPDHRHRCFAEPTPAPRALAHQEAYCLSSAFPVCPTFQDWARREAARSRDPGPGARPATARDGERGSAPPPVVGPGLAAAASSVAGAAAAGAGVGLPSAAPSDEAVADDDGDDAANADAPEPAMPARHRDDLAQRNPPRDWSAPPPWLASSEAGRREDAEPPLFLGRRSSEPGQGLAGSAADRMAGGGYEPQPARDRSRDAGFVPDEERYQDDDVADRGESDWTSSARTSPPPPSGAGRRDRSRDVDDDGRRAEEGDDDDRPRRRRPRAYAQHLGGTDGGPEWEHPRRYEAYPTIRTRVAMPRLPPIAILAVLVVVLAIALFFLPGMLGLGGSGKPTGSAAPSVAAAPSVSLAPTEPPAPTPVLYTVKKGETLSKIATSHGVTVEEILAANPAIKNPNRISEGQQIIIPTPSEEPPDTVGESSAP